MKIGTLNKEEKIDVEVADIVKEDVGPFVIAD